VAYHLEMVEGGACRGRLRDDLLVHGKDWRSHLLEIRAAGVGEDVASRGRSKRCQDDALLCHSTLPYYSGGAAGHCSIQQLRIRLFTRDELQERTRKTRDAMATRPGGNSFRRQDHKWVQPALGPCLRIHSICTNRVEQAAMTNALYESTSPFQRQNTASRSRSQWTVRSTQLILSATGGRSQLAAFEGSCYHSRSLDSREFYSASESQLL